MHHMSNVRESRLELAEARRIVLELFIAECFQPGNDLKRGVQVLLCLQVKGLGRLSKRFVKDLGRQLSSIDHGAASFSVLVRLNLIFVADRAGFLVLNQGVSGRNKWRGANRQVE